MLWLMLLGCSFLPLFNFLGIYIYRLFQCLPAVLKWAVIIGQKLPSNCYSTQGSHVNVTTTEITESAKNNEAPMPF